MLFVIPQFGHAQTLSTAENDEQFEKSFKEMQDLLEKTNLEIDLSDGKSVEKVVYNEEGKEVGVIGIEKVKSDSIDSNKVRPLDEKLPIGVNQTFKVYWYAATVNYHFYVTVRVNSNGLGEIVDAFDEWYVVIPPGVISSDKLEIIRKYETSSAPAEARYTLTATSPVSTKLYIYGRVQNGKFITGGN